MGLTAFQNARRKAAEIANVPMDGMSYDDAIAILSQPLLSPLGETSELTSELTLTDPPGEPSGEPASEPAPSIEQPPTAARKIAKTKAAQAI